MLQPPSSPFLHERAGGCVPPVLCSAASAGAEAKQSMNVSTQLCWLCSEPVLEFAKPMHHEILPVNVSWMGLQLIWYSTSPLPAPYTSCIAAFDFLWLRPARSASPSSGYFIRLCITVSAA